MHAAPRRVENVITGLAHAGVCVPDCAAAVAFYRDVLGLRVLSPPYVMAGKAIRDDMGELVSDPTMKAAIVGFGDGSDRVLEVIEYLNVDGGEQRATAALTDHGRELQSKGVRFLVNGIADVARVRTTWFVDPWGVVFILVERAGPSGRTSRNRGLDAPENHRRRHRRGRRGHRDGDPARRGRLRLHHL